MTDQRDVTLICDLDNTLYDWVGYFVPSIFAMIDRAVTIVGCEKYDLINDLRSVHQFYHNSEHPYALLETNVVKTWLLSGHVSHELNPAFRAFNDERKKLLKTFPGVTNALEIIRKEGVRLIAHSDSNAFAVVDRLSRLGLQNYFDLIYCVENSDVEHPFGGPFSPRFSEFPMEKIRFLNVGEKKPNPHVLKHIIADNDLDIRFTAYVGDSLPKDVGMAKRTGVIAIWARYGTVIDKDLYQKLVKVSHWSSEDVERERELSRGAESVTPDFLCENSFDEVIPILNAINPRIVFAN